LHASNVAGPYIATSVTGPMYTVSCKLQKKAKKVGVIVQWKNVI